MSGMDLNQMIRETVSRIAQGATGLQAAMSAGQGALGDALSLGRPRPLRMIAYDDMVAAA